MARRWRVNLSDQRARLARAVLAGLLLILALGAALALIDTARARQQDVGARARLLDVRYGLLDAERWVEQLSALLARKIDRFEVTADNRPRIKRHIEQLLDRLLIEVEAHLSQHQMQAGNWIERMQAGMRQQVSTWLIDFDMLRGRVPYYADQLLDALNQPRTKAEIRAELLDLIDRAAAATFSVTDRSAIERILSERHCASVDICLDQLDRRSAARQRQIAPQAALVLGAVLALFLLYPPVRRRPPLEGLIALATAVLILLALGVLTPMIEVEARITELRFMVLGEPILFQDQVLYFQSKSLIDVARVLAGAGRPGPWLIAALLLVFSLILPLLKILASAIHVMDAGPVARHPVILFLALRSAKWSMADVLAIAMFMAYIGFDGLIDSQLAPLATASPNLDVMTANGTELAIGFFMFLAFVLSNLALSAAIAADPAQSPVPRPVSADS